MQLLGLPPKTATKELQLTKDMKELVFPIKVEKAAKPGTQKNIFCRVLITDKGEPVMHSRLGGTELRVDKPPPPKKNEPKPKPKPKVVAKKKPAPKKPAPKKVVRLTRLQKLRLKAKQKREGVEGADAGGEKK